MTIASAARFPQASRPDSRGCPGSPFCQPADRLLTRLGLPPSVSWTWLHLGPIGTRATPIAIHGPAAGPVLSVLHPGGATSSGQAGSAVGDVRTWPEHAGHRGYHLDLLGLTRRPPIEIQERYQPTPRLWLICAIAWRRVGGPRAMWTLDDAGRAGLSYHFICRRPDSVGRPSGSDLAEAGRCFDLLDGRHGQIGRPSRSADPSWRRIAEQAEARKAARPALSWDVIAGLLGMHPRTLRLYRQDLRRERDASDPTALAAVGAPDQPSTPGRRPEPHQERGGAER